MGTHYGDVIMGMMASQITSLTIVYSTVYSGADQRKHQSSASLAFVRGIHRGPVNSPHKWPVTRKTFPFDDVIMQTHYYKSLLVLWLENSPWGVGHGSQLVVITIWVFTWSKRIYVSIYLLIAWTPNELRFTIWSAPVTRPHMQINSIVMIFLFKCHNFLRPSLDHIMVWHCPSVQFLACKNSERIGWFVFKFGMPVYLGVPSIDVWSLWSYLIKYPHHSLINDYRIFGVHDVIVLKSEPSYKFRFYRIPIASSTLLLFLPGWTQFWQDSHIIPLPFLTAGTDAYGLGCYVTVFPLG